MSRAAARAWRGRSRARTGRRRPAAPGRAPRARPPAGGRSREAARWPHELGQAPRAVARGRRGREPPCRARRRRLHSVPHDEISCLNIWETSRERLPATPNAEREGLGPPRGPRRGRASPTCSTSICTSCTRSRRRRRSTACASTAATVRRPDLTVATMDHNVPTAGLDQPLEDPISAEADRDVLAPQLRGVRHPLLRDGRSRPGHRARDRARAGLTQPGMTIVCGDSHTSTHGAFGALAFGIGTSEVEHVLATQTLPQMTPGTMAITVDGDAARRRHRQGRRARDHRPHRHRRRHRLGASSTAASRSVRSRWKAA